MHGLFLGSPLGTPTQNKHFLSVRGRNQPDLQPFMHLLPVCAQQVTLKLPQGVLRRTQDVASPASSQKPHIFLARQPTVHNPDSAASSVKIFHVRHDLFQPGGIVAVARTQPNPPPHPPTPHPPPSSH